MAERKTAKVNKDQPEEESPLDVTQDDLREQRDNDENLKLRRDHQANLEAIKFSLDMALKAFEDTSDNHDHAAAVQTIDGVKARLDEIRTEVADLIDAIQRGE